MEDSRIIQLFWDRSQEAISAAAEKYGAYCSAVAGNILSSDQDVEECVNDTWLGAWNAMPPHRPGRLAVFLGKLTRNLAFNRYKRLRAQKRGGGQFELVLEELGECVSGTQDVEQELDRVALAEAIDAFLAGLPKKQRALFLWRYWHGAPVGEIARRAGMTEGNVSVTLHRLRKRLKEHLIKGGFTV